MSGSALEQRLLRAKASQIAQSVRRYCGALEALDMSDCPPDFLVAYRQHVRAWREVEAAVEQLPDGILSAMADGFFNALLRGEADGGVRRMEGALNAAQTRVRDTWEAVERVGAKYGAAPRP